MFKTKLAAMAMFLLLPSVAMAEPLPPLLQWLVEPSGGYRGAAQPAGLRGRSGPEATQACVAACNTLHSYCMEVVADPQLRPDCARRHHFCAWTCAFDYRFAILP
jgi:hypothetical protein